MAENFVDGGVPTTWFGVPACLVYLNGCYPYLDHRARIHVAYIALMVQLATAC